VVVDCAEALSVGPGLVDPDMGPAVTAEQDETNFEYVRSGRQRSPTGKVLFGSVIQNLIFESPVPVVSVSTD
jgi:hypothetical protein